MLVQSMLMYLMSAGHSSVSRTPCTVPVRTPVSQKVSRPTALSGQAVRLRGQWSVRTHLCVRPLFLAPAQDGSRFGLQSWAMSKRLLSLIAVLAWSPAVVGCSFSNVCPAIGWINTVAVTLDGHTQDVAVVELCADNVCSVPHQIQSTSGEPAPTKTLSPSQLATGTSLPDATGALFHASQSSEHSWEIATGMSTPKNATVRALSARGEVLAERDVTLNWSRVGGSESCGGPGEADPISLPIPS